MSRSSVITFWFVDVRGTASTTQVTRWQIWEMKLRLFLLPPLGAVWVSSTTRTNQPTAPKNTWTPNGFQNWISNFNHGLQLSWGVLAGYQVPQISPTVGWDDLCAAGFRKSKQLLKRYVTCLGWSKTFLWECCGPIWVLTQHTLLGDDLKTKDTQVHQEISTVDIGPAKCGNHKLTNQGFPVPV